MKKLIFIILLFSFVVTEGQTYDVFRRYDYGNNYLDTIYRKRDTDSLFRLVEGDYVFVSIIKTKVFIDQSEVIGLSDLLSAKQTSLVSGISIKTINNTSLLGSGNIDIPASVSWGAISGTLADQSDLQTALDAKQAAGNYLVTTNNLSDLSNAATSRTNLGATTVGNNIFTLPNPSAVRYLRINADNTVSSRTAAEMLSDIGAQASGSYVLQSTTVNGQALSGNVNITTVSGNAGTSTALATGRTLSITGDLTWTSPSFDGSANVSAAGTLANVASAGTTGSATLIPVITIDAKGRTTSITTAANTGGWSEVRVSGSNATTTGQVQVDITGLVTGTLTNSTKYEIEVLLDVGTSAVTTGTQYAIQTGGTGGAGVVSVLVLGTTTTNATTATTLSAPGTAAGTFLTTSGTSGTIKMSGFVTTRGSGTATISVQHAKTTSGTSTVRTGSVLRWRLAQ